MTIKQRLPIILMLVVFAFTIGGSGCATKKYVRKSIDERVTPLEGRTQELEETVRRNTQDIKAVDERLTKRIDNVDSKADRAQLTAENAATKAGEADLKAQNADARAGKVERNVEDLRQNLDKFTLLSTVSINFKVNSAVLNPDSKTQLDTLALEAKNHPGYLLEIQGFTDATGSTAANDQLSQERAESVQRYLARQHEIPVYKMSILGLGKIEGEGRGRKARAENRRVDVKLLVNNAVAPGGTQTSTR